jgi:ELWxxDGT repeat protein
MKTVRIVFLLSLVFLSFLNALSSQANVWIDNGVVSRSYHINDKWSDYARIKGNQIIVDEETVISFANRPNVLINSVPNGIPHYTTETSLPMLSLVGLSPAIGDLGESWDKPILTISPNGGEFNTTIEVTIALIAPSGFEGNVVYQIDGATPVQHSINTEKSSFSFYLYQQGMHTVRYKFATENQFKEVTFTIGSSANDLTKDSDGDGIPDSVEAELGLDPLDSSMQDSDGNGWSDFDELVRGGDLTDSDGDGWLDWDEVHLRNTNKDDNHSKPTAHSLYGVEYITTSHAYDGNLPKKPLLRVSFVDLGSEKLYDSMDLLDINLSSTYHNLAISTVVNDDLNHSLQRGVIPQIRIPADVPIVERVQERNEETNSSWIAKAFLASTQPLSLKGYYQEFNKTTPPADFNASVFIQGFIDYLKTNIIVTKDIRVDKNSSISVALLEGAFKSREDSNRTLLLGNPDYPVVGDAYKNILNALNLENRDINGLYLDLGEMLSSSLRNQLLELFKLDNRHDLTENLLAEYLIYHLSASEQYKISLMTLLGYAKAEQFASVWKMDLDSDGDGLTNAKEVFPPLNYSNPLQGDSDDDGFGDAEDPCINDPDNSCMDSGNAQEDSDGDGIVDTADNCPFAKNPDQLDGNNDGIGDECSQGNFVIINPRTRLHLLQGESFTFEADALGEAPLPPFWSIDGEPLPNSATLRYQHFFTKSGDHQFCVGEENKNCVPVKVLPHQLKSAKLNVYVQSEIKEQDHNHTILVELALNEPLSVPVHYTYQTKALLAVAGEDYGAVQGQVDFAPGEMRKFISITIVGDRQHEEEESFVLLVSGDNNQKDIEQEITIIDDDTEVVVPDPIADIALLQKGIELNNLETFEGNIDNNITVSISLNAPITKTGSLHYELQPIVASNNSYNSMVKTPINGDITFEVGEQTKEFNITIIGDMINEHDQNFTIEFSNPINLKLDNSQDTKEITVTIIDDDPLPMIGFKRDAYNTTEGQAYQIRLLLSSKSYKTIEANITLNPKSSAEDSIDMDIDDFNLSTYHVIIPFSTPTTNNNEAVLDINISKNPDNDDGEVAIFDINHSLNAIISSDRNQTTVTIHEVDSPIVNQNYLQSHAFLPFDDTKTAVGEELWISNGISSTKLFADIRVGEDSSSPQYITRVGDNLLYFVARYEEYHLALYVTNGVEGNSTKLYQFKDTELPSNFIDVDGKLYFTLSNTDTGMMSIWSSNGDVTSTHHIVDILEGAEGSDGPTEGFWAVIDKTLYFPANVNGVADSGIELYKLDTVTNTISLVKDIKIGEYSSYPMKLMSVGADLYFVANGATEIWHSDGTTEGTEAIVTDRDDGISEMILNNNILYYSMNSYPSAKLEGINIQNGETYNISSYDDGGNISAMGVLNNYLLYIYASSSNYKIVRVDGANATDFESLTGCPYPTKVFNGYYFYAIDGDLYATNGESSPIRLRQKESDDKGIRILNDTIGDKLFFVVSEDNSLWVSDGTPQKTYQLRPELPQ